ncbi:MAG: TetR/AcrR family transcriptional regulator [Mycobacteriales bacterium]
MSRTRAAVLEGAARAVEKYGARRTTMGDIASLAGIAKATIYNHFRTKEDVLAAAVDTGVRELAAECLQLARSDLAAALHRAADRLAASPALRRLAAEEPALLAAFTAPDEGLVWQFARQAAAALLEAAGREADPAAVDLVLRWVSSHAGAAGTESSRAGGAALLARALSGPATG